MNRGQAGRVSAVLFDGTGSIVTTGTTNVKVRGDATYATGTQNSGHATYSASDGVWYYDYSAAESDFNNVDIYFFNSLALPQKAASFSPKCDFPMDEGTSSSSTDNTISGLTLATPGSIVEITTGTYKGWWSNYSGFNAGTLTFDPPITGLTGAVGYRVWGSPPAPTAAPIRVDLLDAGVQRVWSFIVTGITTANSASKRLTDAGSLGDPWANAVPGSYGAGTAGSILGNRLDVAVSSRSTYSGGAVVLDSSQPAVIADAFLNRNIRGGSNTGRRVFEALGYLRNRVAINKDVSPPVMTIYDIDDTTPLYTAVLSQSSTFDPVLSIDPAGP